MLVSLGTPLVSETVRDKWFDFPRTLGLMVLPAATVLAGLWLWRAAARAGGKSDWQPYAAAVTIFTISFIGLAYSIFPYVVIDRITIWEAAAHPSALRVTFIGAAVVLPFIVGYTILSYRIFRGKAGKNLYD
jgi:cytochrome d ubiquinol oxidase subunit II